MYKGSTRMAQSTRCTAVRSSGSFCDLESLPDAPFPICVKHAAKLLRYLKDFMPNGLDDRIMIAAQMMRDQRERDAPIKERLERDSVVYYVQIGQHIKIGRSENLQRRLHAYPPTRRLLATEPGGPVLEQQRLREFADHLEHGNEWFRPAPELMAHIAELRQRAA